MVPPPLTWSLYSVPLFLSSGSCEDLWVPPVFRNWTQQGTKVPQVNLTHLVVVGYGRFTQLAFEIQLKGKIQVAL